MIYVGLLTMEQAEEINGKEYAPDSFYNVITNPLYIWVKNLPLIEYIPKQIDF
jgi:hypothetical protein